MTEKQAIAKARRLARATGREQFVVWDLGEEFHEWQVTDEEGLLTFHAGISDRNITYCTSEG